MNIQYNKTDYENICKSLRFFKETAKKYGSIFCIVVFPTKPQMYEWLINEKINRKNISTRSSLKIMKRAAKDTGIPFLDIEEELKPIAKELYYSSGNLLWRRCDTHMNDDGNKYTAVIMEKFLKKVRKESGID
jgi:hypothetical protein